MPLIAIAGGIGPPRPARSDLPWRPVVSASPGSPAWLCVAGTGAAIGCATAGRAGIAVLGSGVRGLQGSPDQVAAMLLERWQRLDAAFLDGVGSDLVAIVVDERQGTLTAAVGSGPYRLYSGLDADGSWTIASLATAVGDGRPVERSHEDFLFAHGFSPGGVTAFRGVTALPSGTVTSFPSGDRQPIQSASVVRHKPVSTDGWTKPLYELLLGTVERQAGAAREHAVLLGGFDSALIAALLTGLGHRVHTYTFGFEDVSYQQSNVDVVTSALGSHHTWVPITANVIGEGLATFAEVYNQPVSQPHYLLHTLAAMRVVEGDGFSHVFNGDGCDAAFLGFPTVNRRAEGVFAARWVPAPLARAALAVSRPRQLERHLGHVWRMGRGFLEDVAAPESLRGHLPFTILGNVSRDRLRLGIPVTDAVPVAQLRGDLAGAAVGLDPVRRAFHGHGLTGQSATKVEGAVAATGIVQLSPFQDPEVRAFAASLPTEVLRPATGAPESPGKAVLVRMALELDLLPREVVLQPKQSPSTSPIDRWYSGPLRAQVFEQLAGLPFEWDRSYVEDLLRPKWAEEQYRRRLSIDRHALRAVGLLMTYAAFTARTQ